MSEVVDRETGVISESPADPTPDVPHPATPDDPTPDDPAATPEPEAAPTTPEDFEKMMKDAEREAKRHASAVSRIFGDDATDLEVCPLCSPAVPGFLTPFELHDDEKKTVIQALGLGEAETFREAPDAAECPACGGLGNVLTGSKVPDHYTKLCATCGGTGWASPAAVNGYAAVTNNLVTTEAVADFTHSVAVAVPSTPATDFMSRPYGHPNYGKMSAYMTPDERALDVADGFAPAES